MILNTIKYMYLLVFLSWNNTRIQQCGWEKTYPGDRHKKKWQRLNITLQNEKCDYDLFLTSAQMIWFVIKSKIIMNHKTHFIFIFQIPQSINLVTNKIAWLNMLTREIINICNVRRNTKVYTYVHLFPIPTMNLKNNLIAKFNKNELNNNWMNK